jgi:hypothetical protein
MGIGYRPIVSIAAPEAPAQPVTDEPVAPTRSRRADLLVALVCLAGAIWLTIGLWVDPNGREVAHNRGDQVLFEWLLAFQAHSVTHLTNPWWTTLLNYPIGANLAVNTSMVLVGTLVSPITLLLGPSVAFLVVLTVNLAVSPFAWYWVLSRHVTRTRAAAVLGGLFCGFAPGIVSHANAHLNFTGQFLVPFIVWRTVALARSRRPWRDGVLLGLLVAAEFTIGAELTFFIAGGCAIFVAVWAVQNRPAARALAPAFLRGVLAAGVVALVLLAYPLYLMFLGPQRYHGIGFDQRVHAEDLAAYGAYPYDSLARLAGLWVKLAPNFTEETTFFGPVLLILIVGCFVLLRRQSWIRALGITGLVFAVLSLGPYLRWWGDRTAIPMPFKLLWKLPLFDTALPARFALIVIPIAGLLLALALDRVLEMPLPRAKRLWLAAFALALVPLLPIPLQAIDRAPVPTFFTSGHYRQYVSKGGTLVAIPPTLDTLPDGQRWQAAAHFDFAIPQGFFLGPGPDGRSQVGPNLRPSAQILNDAALKGTDHTVTDADRAQARADLAYWHAQVVVLGDGGAGIRWTARHELLLRLATELFGPPQRVDDVWLWRVH